jgi:glutamine synthetase
MPILPIYRFYEMRQRIVDIIEDMDIKVRYHHHEVGISSQQEIETELLDFPKICDDTMVMKDVIRRTAHEYGLTATFMPKPVYNHAGNGMHFHMMLHKKGKNIFYKKGGYADLSKEAIWFIGSSAMAELWWRSPTLPQTALRDCCLDLKPQ